MSYLSSLRLGPCKMLDNCHERALNEEWRSETLFVLRETVCGRVSFSQTKVDGGILHARIKCRTYGQGENLADGIVRRSYAHAKLSLGHH